MSVYHTDAAEVIRGRLYVIGYINTYGTNSKAMMVHCKDNNVAEYAAIRLCMNHSGDVSVIKTDSTYAVRKFDERYRPLPIDVQFVSRGKNTLANLLVKSFKELLLKKRNS